jgi:simple sugar transport system ATP-binding protein
MPAVELLNITKRFGDLLALDGVSVRFEPARVHGLLGENGAGKTTLMNVLYGLLRADRGEIHLDGRRTPSHSPHDAIAAGVGMVHQHFMLAGAMSVLDNVLLGDRRQGQRLDRRRAGAQLRELGERLGLPIDPAARIGDLAVGQQQRVEILKALYRDVRVLILDEPTAVLTPAETTQLFAAVERLCAEGKSVVFISHKLAEVKRICTDLTVLRRGRVVWEGAAATVSAAELSRHMIGRDIAPISLERTTQTTEPAADTVLELQGVTTGRLLDARLALHGGQIIGIAGVDGNGQQELAEVVVGLRRPEAGRIVIAGQDVTNVPLAARGRPDVAHIPNDRKREGLVPSMNVVENLLLKQHSRKPFGQAGFIAWERAADRANELMAAFDIRAPGPQTAVSTLSGGNQQKVILARELGLGGPRLIVAMNPVRGLDVAATRFVYEQLLARRAAGCGVLLISGDLEELLALCDRVGVLYNGRLTMSHFPAQGVEQIGRMMTGGE